MVNPNLKTLDGVFTYSAISGILLSVFIHTGLDVSETGIAMQILTIVSNTLGSPNPYLIPVVSILVTIIEILVMIHYVRQITEHGPSGIIVSRTGFFWITRNISWHYSRVTNYNVCWSRHVDFRNTCS